MYGLGEIGSMMLTGFRFCYWDRRNLSVPREYFRWSCPRWGTWSCEEVWFWDWNNTWATPCLLPCCPIPIKRLDKPAVCSLPHVLYPIIEKRQSNYLLKMLCILSHLEPACPTFSQLLKIQLMSCLDFCCSQWREMGVHLGQVIPCDAPKWVRWGTFLAGGVCLLPLTVDILP